MEDRLKRIISGNKFLKNLVYNLLVEEDLNDEEILAMRKDACKRCAFNDGLSCTRCGCILEIKQPAKTNLNIHSGRMEVTHCPEGKWNDENLAVYYKSIS